MDIELSKDAKQLLKILYTEYKNRCADGLSKLQAMNFVSSSVIHETLLADWKFDDVDYACGELGKVGLLKCDSADMIRGYRVSLTDNGDAYMENLPKRFLKDAFGIISSFLS